MEKATEEDIAWATEMVTKQTFNHTHRPTDGCVAHFGMRYEKMAHGGYERVYGAKDGEFVFEAAPCHAALMGRKGTRVTFSAFRKIKHLNEINQAFVTFLLDPAVSPYRDILEKNPPIDVKVGNKKFEINTPEFMMDYGYVMYNTEIRADLVGNFFIATRWTLEHPQQAVEWFKMIEKGFNPAYAMMMASIFVPSNCNELKNFNAFAVQFNGGHHPLNSRTMSEKDVKGFVKGVHTERNHPLFGDNSNYTPCNVVWEWNKGDKYSDYILEKYIGKKIEEDENYDPWDDKPPKKQLTRDRLHEIMGLEQKRMKL